jgi:hypothetical protein
MKYIPNIIPFSLGKSGRYEQNTMDWWLCKIASNSIPKQSCTTSFLKFENSSTGCSECLFYKFYKERAISYYSDPVYKPSCYNLRNDGTFIELFRMFLVAKKNEE